MIAIALFVLTRKWGDITFHIIHHDHHSRHHHASLPQHVWRDVITRVCRQRLHKVNQLALYLQVSFSYHINEMAFIGYFPLLNKDVRYYPMGSADVSRIDCRWSFIWLWYKVTFSNISAI